MDDLVLIHGFAMPNNIFAGLIKEFKHKFNCINIELPGDLTASNLSSIEQYVDFIVAQVKRPAIYLGWSLGGLLSLHIAKYHPELVKKLIIVTSSPKFIITKDWQFGIKASNLQNFFTQIKTNYVKTIKQFLALQTMNMPNQRQVMVKLNALVTNTPDLYSLTQQLDILLTSDLRDILPTINQTTLWIMGDKDVLAPAAAGAAASKMMPNASVKTLAGCGHLPFFSHSTDFIYQINQWIKLSKLD